MKKAILSLLFVMCASLTVVAQENAPAFPGAEGFGRYTTGGRGADGKTNVYHVTNLNDSGTGSLRWALSQAGPRTIVFDVSGYIDLESDLEVTSNTTIAGQTAPGKGITLRYYTLLLTSCDNVIVRYIRCRRSQVKNTNQSADAVWARNRKNIIIDHCSFSWSIDETASCYDNRDFTMQWCNVTEGLAYSGEDAGEHSYGGIWGGKNASFHHNFIAHVQTRSPRFNGARYNWDGYDKTKYTNSIQAERVDFRNCVMYNWGNSTGCYGGSGGGYINMVNNYYQAGPGTKNKTRVTVVSFEGDYASRYYISGNHVTAAPTPEYYDWSGVDYERAISIDDEMYMVDENHYYGEDVEYVKNDSDQDCVKIKLDEPIDAGEVTTHSAAAAYEKILAYCGASLCRDDVDLRNMEEARTGTVTFHGDTPHIKDGNSYGPSQTEGIIDFINDPEGEANPKTASYPELEEEACPAGYDTDGDGIPDAWEIANGLDPYDASDAVIYSLDPAKYYTNIEVYINSLVQDIMLAGNADADEEAKEYYPQYTKEDGTVVEAVNTLGIDLSGTNKPSEEAAIYTVSFNGSDIENSTGFFSYGEAYNEQTETGNKHNFNKKFVDEVTDGVMYDGMQFSQGLKMEGSTLIEFTTGSPATVVIVQSTWSTHTIMFDGEELPIASAETPNDDKNKNIRIYTLTNAPAGKHQITRGSGESGLLYVEVRITGTTSISTSETSTNVVRTTYYDLNGRQFSTPQRGANIQVTHFSDGTTQTQKVIVK